MSKHSSHYACDLRIVRVQPGAEERASCSPGTLLFRVWRSAGLPYGTTPPQILSHAREYAIDHVFNVDMVRWARFRICVNRPVEGRTVVRRAPPLFVSISLSSTNKGFHMRSWSRIVFAVLPLIVGGCSTIANPVPLSAIIAAPGDVPEQGRALTELMNCEGDLRYIPVPPFQANDYTVVQLVGGIPTVTRMPFPTDTNAINRLLPNLSMDVSTGEIAGGGQAFWFKTDLTHRKIVMDFMKSRTEPIVDAGNKFYGYGRVGAGLRLKIDLWTSESSFDGSLVGLAASAKAKTAYGRITAETVGVDNSDITLSMPFSADFSEGSIQKVIEALAVIKSRLHDKTNTTLVPHFLAKVSCSKTTEAASKK